MPAEIRSLGDRYVKNEFRLHKSANATQVDNFMVEWTRYLMHLKRQRGNYGVAMSDQQASLLSDEQVEKIKRSVADEVTRNT